MASDNGERDYDALEAQELQEMAEDRLRGECRRLRALLRRVYETQAVQRYAPVELLDAIYDETRRGV